MSRRLLPLLLIACALALVGCLGPRPTVVGHELRPPQQPGDPYVMIVTIKNRGRGNGEVSVDVALKSPDTGVTVAAGDKQIQMKGHETTQVAIELYPGAPGPYEASAGVTYPP